MTGRTAPGGALDERDEARDASAVRSLAPTVSIRTQSPPARPRSRPAIAVLIGRIVFFGLLFALWYWVTTATYLGKSISTPWDTAVAFVELPFTDDFWRSVFMTMRSTVIGVVLSVVLGVGVGLILSIGPHFYRSTSFVIDFLRTVPGLAILPLGILVLGPTMELDLLMIVFSAVWPVLIQTVYAVRQLDTELLETVRTYRVPPIRRFLTVILPACLPRIATGIRISATMVLLLAVGTELLAGSPGLGNLISVYQQNSVYPELYACIIWTGILGYLFTMGIRAIERRALVWHFTPRAMAENS